MAEHSKWKTKAPNLLKTELKQQAMTYAQFAERIGDKEVSVRSKLSQSKFTAAFLLHSLETIGLAELRLR